MDSKKSLGHFPFGPGSQGDSDYSFIPDLNQSEDIDVDVDSAEVNEADFFQSRPAENRKPETTENPEPDSLQYIQIGSVKVKKTPETKSFREQERSSQESPENYIVEREIVKPSDSSDPVLKPSSGSSKKKIVSYYLAEELIDRLKAYADSVNESYSAVAAASFEEYLQKKVQ